MAALLARAEADAEAPTWSERIRREADPRTKLQLFAAWSRALFTTGRDVIAAVFHGPAVSELHDEGNRRRRQAIDALVAALAAAGALRPDITAQQAADRAWILTGPEVYLLATACGWSPEQYQDWLAALLSHQLLQPW
jgi:hypothetical protein